MSLNVMDVDMVKIATKASVLELFSKPTKFFFLGIPSSTQEPSQVERALKGFRRLCMWQIEPVATTWQIGLSRCLAGLNLNTDPGTFKPNKSAAVKSMQPKRATWLFGEGYQTSAVRDGCSAAGERASITFCESCFNCAISQPCNFSFVSPMLWVLSCVSPIMACLPSWRSLRAHSCLYSLHTSVLAFLCCSVSGWSLQCKDMSFIPVVMISAETRWSCSKIPSHLLEGCCYINKKKKSRHAAAGKSEPSRCRRNIGIQIKGHFKILHKRGERTAAVGPKVFSKNLSGAVEADNYCARTCATFPSHTSVCTGCQRRKTFVLAS